MRRRVGVGIRGCGVDLKGCVGLGVGCERKEESGLCIGNWVWAGILTVSFTVCDSPVAVLGRPAKPHIVLLNLST